MKKVRHTPVIWEQEYQKGVIWKQKPHHYTVDAAARLSGGRAIDLGAGEGHDALYLAKQGFMVSALDSSQTALQRIRDEAASRHLRLEYLEQDIRTFHFTDIYDLVCSYGALHFLRAQGPACMREAMAHTRKGGVHSMYLFSNHGDFYDIGGATFWFPSPQDIEELYSGWRIIVLERKRTKLFIKDDHGNTMHNDMIKLLAQNT
jgi:SAM-dependent methyltransferase